MTFLFLSNRNFKRIVRFIQDRRALLKAELAQIDEKLAHIYRAIEDGNVELDDQPKVRIMAQKGERDLAQVCFDLIAEQLNIRTAITPERITEFTDRCAIKSTMGMFMPKRPI